MARTGGEKTKAKILQAAEKIFSAKGYDGTSIQEISNTAGINKALIYYHFINKQDIIDTLFSQTLDEMFGMQSSSDDQIEQSLHGCDVDEKVGEIITFLQKKKKILTIMLMEALKNDKDGYHSLFKCADTIISKNVSDIMHSFTDHQKKHVNRGELMMHEFFTGFVPIVFFALFRDKWADYFQTDRDAMMKMFINIFKKSHIRHE
jgi:AcrR family transcriptional regulator